MPSGRAKPTAIREKVILAGLYLSKFDLAGVRKPGFESFAEAFNVVGYALGSKPASVKNYRDEFDPLVSRRRKGWHKRPIRAHCLAVFEEYKALDFESFTGLINAFLGYDRNLWSELEPTEQPDDSGSAFAQRLITGLAAEQYFESVKASQEGFLAVEVKGLKDRTGGLSLTPKEYEAAKNLRERFFLFVVRNFRDLVDDRIAGTRPTRYRKIRIAKYTGL